jgi:hypothetical protein
LAKQAGIDEVTLLEYYDNDDVNWWIKTTI